MAQKSWAQRLFKKWSGARLGGSKVCNGHLLTAAGQGRLMGGRLDATLVQEVSLFATFVRQSIPALSLNLLQEAAKGGA